MPKPSENHKNRQAYNWLLYDQSDKYLQEYSPYYKGVMLDMGCADAPYKEFFLNYVDKYIGIDWTNSLHDTTVDVVSDLNSKINLEDECADTIVALNVLEHLNEPQIFLNEAFRLLKPGSYMILHIPFQWWVHEHPHDYFRYTPSGIKYMLEKSGFQNVKVQPTSGFFTMLFLKINYFSRRLAKGSKLKNKIVTQVLKPFWYLSQKLAPKLDSMHRGWSLEAQSFFVIALKGGKDKDRYCPICEKYSKTFGSFGYTQREDAECPSCGSLERHRLSWLVIDKELQGIKIEEKNMLHIAPEKVFMQKFDKLFKDNYLTADLNDKRAKLQMDITNIDYPSESFDYIYCSHVLEHIEDDRKAMKELCRVTKKDGWAILLVPIMTKGPTEEDHSINTPEERMKHYGHPEHVRNYGCDYKERLEESGWEVEVIYAEDFLTPKEIELMGITKAAGEIYFCTKKI